MTQIIMTKGLPASGKSTWAKAQVAQYPDRYKRISKDDLRAMLDAGKHSKAREAFVVAARDALVRVALEQGYTPIVDDTNLNPIHEARLRDIADTCGAHLVIQDFSDVPLDTCLTRDQQRPNYVGERVIRRMWREYLATPMSPPMHIPDAPYAVMCDLDGTLAIMSDRSPYDETRCDEDALNESVAQVVRLAQRHGDTILFVSGRKERGREPTLRFLMRHNLPTDHLYMRADDDNRHDHETKRDLYDAHIAGKFNVRFVLDDRTQVVRLWRSLGLPCFQVADGDF